MHYLLLFVPLVCVIPWLVLELRERNAPRILLGVISLLLVCGATWLSVELSWVRPYVLTDYERAALQSSVRALSDLAQLTGLPQDVHLVGSHGSEFDLDFATSLPQEAAALRERIESELAAVAADEDGFLIEAKPASVAFHYRNAEADKAAQALKTVLDGPGSMEGVFTRHGKKVVEFGVVATSKGNALETMRHRSGASAVIFFGDDRTDEDAFATLAGPDIGIKVGEGDSIARYRVDGPGDVAQVLARLSELRGQWLAGAEAVEIERHSMLSDQRTIAMVTPGARVAWMCVPRLDSPALFAELLGGPTAGHFSIHPADGTAAPCATAGP